MMPESVIVGVVIKKKAFQMKRFQTFYNPRHANNYAPSRVFRVGGAECPKNSRE